MISCQNAANSQKHDEQISAQIRTRCPFYITNENQILKYSVPCPRPFPMRYVFGDGEGHIV